MTRRKVAFISGLLLGIHYVAAGSAALTLDSCRTLAVTNSKELRKSEAEMTAAFYNRKSAFTNYLPKVGMSGIYMHTGKEVSILSDQQKATLSGIGDVLSVPALNSVGEGVVEAFRTDTRNMGGAAVILTQPVYMGGKIKAYESITRYAEAIAADRHEVKHQEVLVEVDETYWSIVGLSARRRLAEGYLSLVRKLDSDIERIIEEGFATKADGLSVKVKVNEANVALIQVENGIELLRMRLCQLCGLPLDSTVILADETADEIDVALMDCPSDSDAWEKRPELSALEAAVLLHDEKVKAVRSEFLPNVVLTGGYFASYPSAFNSFEKKFKGTWNVGVAVNIPLLTWGDRSYKVKGARAEAAAARMTLEETREKIELQVHQSRQKVREAHERYEASLSSQAEADENLRFATSGLREGVIPVSNVLEAQTAWLSAKANLISASIDVRMAYVYLNKSLGTLK